MKKQPKEKKEQTEDKVAIVLRSLIMILVSRGFLCKLTGETLMDFLKDGSKDKTQ